MSDEINITIGMGDIVKDYAEFMHVLNSKFSFKDKDAFEQDFLKLIDTIPVNTAFEGEKIFDSFVELISKHANDPSIEHNSQMAKEEIERVLKRE